MLPPNYGLLMRRLVGYILIIGGVGTLFWLLAVLRDLY